MLPKSPFCGAEVELEPNKPVPVVGAVLAGALVALPNKPFAGADEPNKPVLWGVPGAGCEFEEPKRPFYRV